MRTSNNPHIHSSGHRLFTFAVLWERWYQDEQSVESCTLITTEANPTMQQIHQRMPVILNAVDYGCWLGEEDGDLERLLQPCGGEAR